ncbi:MAG: DUF948 domain-containing protein [Nitrospira sp.]|nr:DUF948 domain-containing protein [Nitrospira sp.]
MIGEIAPCVGAVAFAVLVGMLIPLLIRLRQSVAESERLLASLNFEVPLLLQEIRAATENLNSLIGHARSGVEHAAVLLHAAGAVGDTIQRVQETVRGGGRSLLVTLVSMAAGFRATKAVVKTQISREGGMVNGKGGTLNGR